MSQPATAARPALRFVLPANAAFIRIPYFPQGIAAGFPSPADDHLQKALDLHEHLIKHPAAFPRIMVPTVVAQPTVSVAVADDDSTTTVQGFLKEADSRDT